MNNTEPLKVGELKPCPFCGATPDVEPKNPKIEGDAWTRIVCKNDGCWVKPHASAYIDGDHYSAAREAWNRRTEPSPAAPITISNEMERSLNQNIPSPAEVSSDGLRESDKQLLAFYDVSTLPELVDAMEKHILSLQETARRYLPQQYIVTNGGRQG